jgi:hypothetical protein
MCGSTSTVSSIERTHYHRYRYSDAAQGELNLCDAVMASTLATATIQLRVITTEPSKSKLKSIS